MAIAGPVLAAADRVHQEIRTQAASLVVAVIMFASAARISLVAVAWAVPLVYAFRFWWTTRPALRLLGIRWRELAAVLSGPVLAAAFTTACVYAASRFGQGGAGAPVVIMLVLTFVGLIAFLLIAYVGGRTIVPAALVTPLLGRAANVPSWITRRLQPFAIPPESGVPPAV
jgi:hypothetical protein